MMEGMDPNESIAALRDTLNEQGKILKLSSISDVVRRDCALLILQSVAEFLQSWRKGAVLEVHELRSAWRTK